MVVIRPDTGEGLEVVKLAFAEGVFYLSIRTG